MLLFADDFPDRVLQAICDAANVMPQPSKQSKFSNSGDGQSASRLGRQELSRNQQ